MTHSAEKRQKMSSKGILGMKIMEMAVKNAAEPQIKDDTLVTLPFSLILLPISMAITVPMILQGPPMQFPIRNMATQYCHAMLVSAKDTMNMMIELSNRSGLKKRALLLQWSTRQPTAVPPIKLPRSIMLEMQPFCDSMSPPFLAKKIGSQKSSPQMHPFKQEYPRTYRGTRGRHITEKIPQFKPGWFYAIFYYSLTASLLSVFVSPSVSREPSIQLRICWFSSGFSLSRKSMRMATATANPPVTAKFHTQDR